MFSTSLLYPVHRLDKVCDVNCAFYAKDTTGVLLVARDRETARALGHEFACHEVSKLYLAAGYDVSFSSSHLPRVGIVYSDLVSICDAKRI